MICDFCGLTIVEGEQGVDAGSIEIAICEKRDGKYFPLGKSEPTKDKVTCGGCVPSLKITREIIASTEGNQY